MTQTNLVETSDAVTYLVFGTLFLVPAALMSSLLWLAVKNRLRHCLIPLLSATGVTLLTTLLSYMQYSSDSFWLTIIITIATALGSFGCIGCILLYGWLQKKLPSVFNRETISYIVFGVLTTVVSFVSQMMFSAAGFPVIVNTIGSWVCAVLFAYVVNKLFVFESKTDTATAFWRELGLFIGARVASLGMELVFMFVTVELLNFSEAVCKLIAQVFILIANYIFSKLVIFKKN